MLITYDQYRTNFISLDNNIKLDYNDPIPSLRDFTNFYDYFNLKSKLSGIEIILLFNNEAVPTFVKNVLRRKYASNDEHINFARIFLEKTSAYISRNLHLDYEGLTSLLPVLFDSNEPFYQKYGFPRVENLNLPVANVSVINSNYTLDETFRNSIEIGSCIDCLNDSGGWELAIVESLGPTSTEIEVFLTISEKKEWISLESGAYRLAPFGTKVKDFIDESAKESNHDTQSAFISDENINPNSTVSAVNVEPVSPTTIGPEEFSWKFHVMIGDLIDARDPHGVWYQAVVIDMKQIEVKSASDYNNVIVEEPHTPSSPLEPPPEHFHNSSLNVASNIDEIHSTITDDDNTNKRVKVEHICEIDNSPSHLIADITLNDIEVITNEINSSDLSLDSNIDDNIYDIDETNQDITQASTNNTTYIKVTLRVSFIGFPEKNDEWIDVDSPRIASFNSMSCNRRGDNPIREEILYLINPIQSMNEYSDIAVLRDSCFVSIYYVNVVNTFGSTCGFENIIKILGVTEQPVSILTCISIAIALGNASMVLSLGFLKKFTSAQFLPLILPRLAGMTLPEIRQTPVEMIEFALKGIESLCIATVGRGEISGAWIEKPWLKISENLLVCPYLNRRLGGLKLITELIRRGHNKKSSNGIVYTYTYPNISENSSSSGNTPTSKSNNDNLPHVSIRVVPILYAIDLRYICEKILNKSIIHNIFIGESSHGSLMIRTFEILQTLIFEGFMSKELLDILWTASYTNKEDQAMKVLTDLIQLIPTIYLKILYEYISMISYNLITSSLVDLLSCMCLRTRNILLYSNSLEETKFIYDDIDLSSTHSSLLHQLWLWCEDSSICNDQIISYILNKFDLILGCSLPHAQIYERNYFPWDIQWDRCANLIDLAMNNLNSNKSIILGYKIIFSFMNSFPVKVHNTVVYKPIPITKYCRSSVANYFEYFYKITSIITSNIVFSKSLLGIALKDIPLANDETTYSTEIQNVINDLVLPNIRIRYKDFLLKAFDSMFMIIRFGEELELKQEIIQTIWEKIVENAVTMNEVECVVAFIKRATNPLIPRSNNKRNNKQNNVNSESEETVLNGFSRKSLMSNNTILHIFYSLLCNKDKFISSKYYNDIAYQCTERLFINININSNLILEYKDKEKSFVIIGPPTQLLYWEVFIDIALNTLLDSIALLAIKFITSFPQKLSISLLNTNENVNIRKNLLINSIKQLKLLNIYESNNYNKIKRCLMLLDHILDESAYDSRYLLRPHGYLLTNIYVQFKINATSKNLSIYHGKIIEILTTESVQDLIDKILNAINQPLSSIKITFRAKDLLSYDKKKVLNSLGITFSDMESLIIIDKSIVTNNNAALFNNQITMVKSEEESSKSVRFEGFDKCNILPTENASIHDNTNSTNESLLNISIDKSTLPASIVSQTPEYIELLFYLLDHSNSSMCDDLWKLLNRLPTSPSVLNGLLFISNNNLVDFLKDSCRQRDENNNCLENLSFSRILYHLQVVDYLIQPFHLIEKRNIIEKLFSDISFEQLDEWPKLFLLKDGPSAVLNLFDYISTYLSNYLDNANNATYGCSNTMILLSLQLVTKLSRSLLLRMTIQSMKKKETYNNELFNAILVNNELVISDSFDIKSFKKIKDKVNEEKSSEEIDKVMDISTVTNVPEVIEDVNPKETLLDLSNEWGYQLNDKDIPIFVNSSNDTIIQNLLLNLIINLRKFSLRDMFMMDNSIISTINDRFVVQRRYDNMICVVGNIYIIWSCCLLLNPLLYQHIITETKLLINVIRYGILGDKPNNSLIESNIDKADDSNSTSYTLGGILSRCYIKIFECIITQTYSINKILVKPFCNQLFQSLINLLPNMVYNHPNMPSDSLTYSSLFQITCRLIELSNSLGQENNESILDNELLIETSMSIYNMLQFSYNQLNEKGNISIFYIDGVLRILTTICHYHTSIIEYLYNNKILSFLLINCLGLKSVNFNDYLSNVNYVVHLCNDESSKSNTYHLLKEIIEWKNDLILDVVLYLRPIYLTIPTPKSWNYDISNDTISRTGYVGLRNFGCTCYMNSLLQILYMIPQFRDAILNISVMSSYFTSEEDIKNDYIYQLQKIFLNLKYNKKKSFSPDDWIYCYKDETNAQPISTSDQQDAQEFFQVLFDRLQSNYSKLYNKNDKNSFINLIGGKVCDQMIRQSNNNSPINSNSSDDKIKERTESFVCLSIDVKGSKGLDDSLNKYIQGEYINDFLWDYSNGTSERVTIMKRQCISDLSNTLIFHLKRFELNFDTFLREKVNDYFPFTQYIDMYPYTRDGIMSSLQDSRPRSFYQYELCGIVVHTGTADSGHYFSYIRDSNTNQWYEFNDSLVKEFSEAPIEAECFGGNKISHDYNKVTETFYTAETPNPKSAYMLMYQRITPIYDIPENSHRNDIIDNGINDINSIDRSISTNDAMIVKEKLDDKKIVKDFTQSTDNVIIIENDKNTQMSDNEMMDIYDKDGNDVNREMSLTNQIICDIFNDNMIYLLSSKILSLSHTTFLTDLLILYQDFLKNNTLSNISDYQPTLVYEFSIIGLRLLVKLSYLPIIKQYLESLTSVIELLYHNNYAKKHVTINEIRSTTSDLTDAISNKDYISNYPYMISLFIYNNLSKLIIPGLFHNELDLRSRLSITVFSMYICILNYFECDSSWVNPVNMIEIRNNTISSNYREAYKVSEINSNNDNDLELAIQLSQSSYLATPLLQSTATNTINIPNIPSNTNYSLQILLELTSINNLNMISEHWRRSDAMISLLLKLCSHNNIMTQLFIFREFVSVIIDIILCDQSPLCDVLYDRKGHKFAVSSYQTVYPINKKFELTINHKNIPDWSGLIEMLSIMIKEYRNMLRIQRNIFANSYSMMNNFNNSVEILSKWDLECLHNKSFITVCIRQYRYSKPLIDIILLESLDNNIYSEMICEIIIEYISSGTYESTYQIFHLLDSFCAINDSIKNQRFNKLFPLAYIQNNHINNTNNNMNNINIISILFNMKDIITNHKYICICLSSLFHILLVNYNLRDWLCRPIALLSSWVPWMMKFSFQYMNRCIKEYELLNNTNNSLAKTSIITGPFVLVYGDNDDEHELLWTQRSEKCFHLLQSLLTSINVQPDNYIPEDAFNEVEVIPDMIGPKQYDIDVEPAVESLLHLQDGMTDEEFERALL